MLMSPYIKLKAQLAPQTEKTSFVIRGVVGVLVEVGGVIKEGRVLLKGLEHKIDVSNHSPFHFPNLHKN